jgi:NADPH-dependent 2,4-dienoyl-CoA reductase/sulfur reductase-like enzyme
MFKNGVVASGNMLEFKYIIIGGGMTADAAVRGIRSVDPVGSIALFSKEEHPPYKRPPLSKALWKGDPVDSIWLNTEEQNVVLYLNRAVESISPDDHRIVDEQGETYSYEKLLLATGGTPRHLRDAPEGIIYYRTFDDYENLRELASRVEKFVIIGGGFIGSEVAAALNMQGKDVTMIFPETGIGALLFPQDLSDHVNAYYREKGVTVLAGEMVASVRNEGDGYIVATESGQEIAADAIIAGIGVIPNTELAQAAGIEVDNGIIVDEYCRTSTPDVYAAGDAASFVNPALGARIRVEHDDNTQEMGECAGKNMAGSPEEYTHLPFFYSDLFEMGYEAVGKVDPRLDTIADWKEVNEEGIVYYMEETRVRGALLWGIFEQVDNATEIIADSGPFTAENLMGRLPKEQHEEEGEEKEENPLMS